MVVGFGLSVDGVCGVEDGWIVVVDGGGLV